MKCWTRQFTLEFIELLRSQTYMWDMQNPDYRSTVVRRRGYNMLMHKAREVDPNATVDDVKRKIKGLRTNLKKMERRVLAYRRCGLEHQPSLFYYQPLSFLLTQDRHGGRVPTDESSPGAGLRRYSQDSSGGTNEDDSHDAPQREVREHVGRTRSEIMDCTVFGQYVAAKLVSIAKLQRIYLEKVINDAIYHAELGNLSPRTRLCKEQKFQNSDSTYFLNLGSATEERIPSDMVVMEEVGTGENGVVLQEIVVENYEQVAADCEQDPAQLCKIEVVEIPEHGYFKEAENQIVPQAGPSYVVRSRAAVTNSNQQGVSTVDSEQATDVRHYVTVENHNISFIENDIAAENGVVINDNVVVKTEYSANGASVAADETETNGLEQGDSGSVEDAAESITTLKNVEFADDDIMKMCEDDGITIICVEESDSLDDSSCA